jgi:hypothetical protein
MLLMKLALPHAQRSPAAISKIARDDLVARHITVELTLPEFESAFRCVGEFAPGMPMPKAAIYKQSYVLSRKNKIGLAEYMRVSPPAGDAMLPKQRNHPEFRVPIAAGADPRHYVRAFFWREDVRHEAEFNAKDSYRHARGT